MLPGLSEQHQQEHQEQQPPRGVGYYLHAKLAQLKKAEVAALLRGVDAQDVLFNDETDVLAVLRFLRMHEVIVTSSYHGVLWATYMNIPVYSVFDFSEKFANLPFSLQKYPLSDENKPKPALSRELLVDGTLLREQCIHANLAFYATYVEPFVSVLQTLAHAAPLLPGTESSSGGGGWLGMADFDLREVAATSRADCSPLHRNHVYLQQTSPQYEANLYVQLDARYSVMQATDAMMKYDI